eukprot:TRINITY_DN2783_c0_g1_i5.p1 TRINITY_DN2783_c0_g1~~TRINITY_DN2783_c0_g1_i5.p1  ORF type:complete len:1070 (-),score=205.88 TRINITY_DN2783_c0_g1_i5:126-3335(-)
MIIKEVSRNAAAAWSPLPHTPDLLIAGTVAGALDDSFSSSATLEIFSLQMGAAEVQSSPHMQQSLSQQMQPIGRASANYRFHRIEWAARNNDASLPYGLVAGGMDNGSITFWDPARLLQPQEGEYPLLATTEKHTGPVKALDFNPFQQNLLASGATDSEIYVWDVSNINAPSVYSPGVKGSQSVDITCVAWNRKVAHILGSATHNGQCVIWDLKARRPVINFSDSSKMRSCRAIAWNPDVATQIATSSDDERNPVVQLWDLRNAYSPVKEFMGHNKGVLSLAWNPYDSQILVSSGKDHRTLCWNPETGDLLCELPQATHWNFDVRWSPRIPSLLCASSFGRKVAVHSLQDLNTQADQQFDVSSQEKVASHVPKWLQRPAGAAFGFGGKLITFGKPKRVTGTEPFTVSVQEVPGDQFVSQRAESLEAAVEAKALLDYCESKARTAESLQEQELWNFMGILNSKESRRDLIQRAGFDSSALLNAIDQHLHQASGSGPETSLTNRDENSTPPPHDEPEATESSSNVSQLFSASTNGEDFPAAISHLRISAFSEAPVVNILNQNESDPEYQITRALLLGDFARAVDCCFKANRPADALLLAASGSTELWSSARARYLTQQNNSFSKFVSAIVSGELDTLVAQSNLGQWKETLAVLATYAKGDQFGELCSNLGLRLEQEVDDVHSALLCYVLAGDKRRVVDIWLGEYVRKNKSADALVALVEKIVIFRQSVGDSEPLEEAEGELEDYANLLAINGKLQLAFKYLTFGKVDVAERSQTPALMDRIYHCLPEPPTTAPPAFPFERVAVDAFTPKEPEPTPITTATNVTPSSSAPQTPYSQPEQPQSSYAPGPSPLSHSASLATTASPGMRTNPLTGQSNSVYGAGPASYSLPTQPAPTPYPSYSNPSAPQPSIFVPNPSSGYNAPYGGGMNPAAPTTIFSPPAPNTVTGPPPPSSGPAPTSAFAPAHTAPTHHASAPSSATAPHFTTFVPSANSSMPSSTTASHAMGPPPTGATHTAHAANPSNPAAAPTNSVPQPEPPKPNPALNHPIIRSLMAHVESCNAHPQVAFCHFPFHFM